MFVVAVILILWYVAHAVLSRFVGTCTMGDADRFVAGLVFGAPAALAASALLTARPAIATWQRVALVLPLLLAPVLLYLWVPLGISSVLQGHHLCGADFDAYLSYAPAWAAYIPFLHVALVVTIVLASIGSYLQGLRRAA